MAAVGQVPFNFQLGADIHGIKLNPPQTPSGELEVRVDGCDGEPVATLSLQPALANNAVTELPGGEDCTPRRKARLVFEVYPTITRPDVGDRPGPAGVNVAASKLILLSPLQGWSAPLEETPDPVFSGRMMGDGVAIDPTGTTLHAPCDGTLIVVAASKHAVTIRADKRRGDSAACGYRYGWAGGAGV